MAKLSLSSKSYNPKGYKTSTSKAMKEAGAKSSRTDSSGVTNFYSSGKDIDAGKAPISTMKNGVPVITPQSLATVPKPNTPGAPTLPDPGNMAQANNTALGSMLGDLGISTDQNGLFVTNSTPQKDNYTALYEQYLQTQMGIDQPNNEKILRDLEREAGIKQKQQEVTNYTSQLNAITANAQAEALKLEGQGRGQTSGFIGGEQARINREAAIAALPVQAQLAAAQGNLEMAQSHVDKMFAVRSQDAQARYQFKTKMVESLFDFANAQETRRLQELQRKEDRAYQEETRNMSLANEWAKTAIEYGQSSLAGRIMALDPKSKTYAQDLSKLQGQVQKPAPTPTAKAPTLQNFGTAAAPLWKEYDAASGTWKNVSGLEGPQQNQEQFIQSELSSVQNISSLTTHEGMSKAVGTNKLARWTPFKADVTTGKVSDFIASVDQLTKGLTLDNLISAKERGATFGALSIPEMKLLEDSATKINAWRRTNEDGSTAFFNAAERDFKRELDTINNFKKLDLIIRGVPPDQVGVQVMQDGTYWTQNSDGTLTQIGS